LQISKSMIIIKDRVEGRIILIFARNTLVTS